MRKEVETGKKEKKCQEGNVLNEDYNLKSCTFLFNNTCHAHKTS